MALPYSLPTFNRAADLKQQLRDLKQQHGLHCLLRLLQLFANLAEQGIGGIKPEVRDETRGLPLSDSRYPEGATIAGDETKIRSGINWHVVRALINLEH